MSPLSVPVSLTPHHRAENFGIASYASLVIIVWGRDAQAADLELLREVQRQVVDDHAHFAVLTIIRAGLSVNVDDEVREASSRNLEEFAKTNFGAAMVVESGGFRAVFFRSILTSIQLLTRSPVQQRVFNSIDDALDWLCARPGLAAKLADSLDQLRTSVHAFADDHGQDPKAGR